MSAGGDRQNGPFTRGVTGLQVMDVKPQRRATSWSRLRTNPTALGSPPSITPSRSAGYTSPSFIGVAWTPTRGRCRISGSPEA